MASQTWLIKTYMDRAARQCSVTPPSDWIADTDTNSVVLMGCLVDTVDELLDRHDWNQCTLTETITGTGATSYDLPNHFRRLCTEGNAVYETTGNKRPLIPITKSADWTEMQAWNTTGGNRYYRLQGRSLEVYDALPADNVIKVAYVSNRWVLTAAGDSEMAWSSANTDQSYIPGQLLQYGVKWRFRQHKRLSYVDDKAIYEGTLARMMGDDKPQRRVNFSGPSVPEHPMRVPIIDRIPTA